MYKVSVRNEILHVCFVITYFNAGINAIISQFNKVANTLLTASKNLVNIVLTRMH